MNPVLEAIFGNRTAAWVLLFLQCYGEGHALRIAKTFLCCCRRQSYEPGFSATSGDSCSSL
jgi:hypothetical protein